MNEFTNLLLDLSNNLNTNNDFFISRVRKNPQMVFVKVNELARFVGSRYGLTLELHFPDQNMIYQVQDYGSENLSLVFDKFSKKFPIARELIKEKAFEVFDSQIGVYDAYMYEGKEGVRILFNKNSIGNDRIEILPGSLHLWCKIDSKVQDFSNWLLENIYPHRKK
ncbi:MAG: hypothetical protein AB7V56_07895 [Candidatus Nitrosocosmicus sp.]